MPRVPHYQTTPFTIDPSARSTQTFAERYGVSPPHSNENLYGNDYTITESQHDEKLFEAHTKNHLLDLSKAPTSSNIQQSNNNKNESDFSSKAFKSTVIKGSSVLPNSKHLASFDVEHRLQVRFNHPSAILFSMRHIHHIIYARNIFGLIHANQKSFSSSTCGNIHLPVILVPRFSLVKPALFSAIILPIL